MDEEDYMSLITLVGDEMRGVGAGDVANERHYLIEPEDGASESVPRLLPPAKRLIAMLKAFDRFLAVRDGSLYNAALDLIGRRVEGERPNGAVVVGADSELSETVDLAIIPDLSELRANLQNLIDQLIEADLGLGFRR